MSKPVHEKLGIQPGDTLLLVNAPKDYFTFLGLPKTEVTLAARHGKSVKNVHAFAETETDLRILLDKLAPKIEAGQALWVSWKKGKVSRVTDVVVRKHGLAGGLVDVKVCSVSEVWSGLKFVRRTNQ